jgi:hypothetical protein
VPAAVALLMKLAVLAVPDGDGVPGADGEGDGLLDADEDGDGDVEPPLDEELCWPATTCPAGIFTAGILTTVRLPSGGSGFASVGAG